jgi:hypothetical protein
MGSDSIDYRAEIVRRLSRLGYRYPTLFPRQDHWAAVISFGSFVAIVDGDEAASFVGYKGRWVYRSEDDAKLALAFWDGRGEPTGFISGSHDTAMTVWP